ncbi:alpha/beta-type small acid-soluble spore protein [Bacillus alkalicellulosilyticus]|uniref:alpha/beta-type small acid-soluble spore protein n=1 Tax=Alkalihalobacterium alkalicellulosilyticum TaxID=1912214 RepID=UPI0009981D95|nr:alpha/beta-type small acid-soluble spore protein [Bacillus alkalicellulosilyticus]
MARRNNRILVPEARQALNHLKQNVMRQKGYLNQSNDPNDVKYEVANELNVPLQKGYNGTLTSKQAGKVGGTIGGSMVKEMIRMAQNNLKK